MFVVFCNAVIAAETTAASLGSFTFPVRLAVFTCASRPAENTVKTPMILMAAPGLHGRVRLASEFPENSQPLTRVTRSHHVQKGVYTSVVPEGNGWKEQRPVR